MPQKKRKPARPHFFTVRLVLSDEELKYFQTGHKALVEAIAETPIPTLSLASYLRMRANDLLINEAKNALQPTSLSTEAL
ncbi:hypothetical protein [Hugenholtzia roseola]|uniref:hypothetical protein n=1 Tax=Hugenholtzia roseola TaxID=1002 RepID=UPI0003F797EB|nr:hypothetical protein [Hugenholtzia roseola]